MTRIGLWEIDGKKAKLRQNGTDIVVQLIKLLIPHISVLLQVHAHLLLIQVPDEVLGKGSRRYHPGGITKWSSCSLFFNRPGCCHLGKIEDLCLCLLVSALLSVVLPFK